MNKWAIIDNKSILHTGSKEEMLIEFEEMTSGTHDNCQNWYGDLILIEIHKVFR